MICGGRQSKPQARTDQLSSWSEANLGSTEDAMADDARTMEETSEGVDAGDGVDDDEDDGANDGAIIE